jgi:copper chaperone
MTGVDSYNIDLKEQKVSVTGNVKPDEVLDRISRTGKTTAFWPKDDKGEAVAA